MDRADCALIHVRKLYYARVTHTYQHSSTWADINAWFGTGLIRSLDSSHWLLIFIHINECVNVFPGHASLFESVKWK